MSTRMGLKRPVAPQMPTTAPPTLRGAAVPFAGTSRPLRDLHVVGVYNNPRRWASRERLFLEWVERTMATPGVMLTIVEHAFGERPHLFKASRKLPFNLVQFRGGPEHEVWLKEALINAGFNSILQKWPEARYLCWEDADVQHVHPSWADETVHMLQHHRVGQTWSSSVDLDPGYAAVEHSPGRGVDRSFCAAWIMGDLKSTPDRISLLDNPNSIDRRRHTGYSWAIRADALKGIGKLIDWLVVGSGDFLMAEAFAGRLDGLLEQGTGRFCGTTPGYRRRLAEFSRKSDMHIRQDIGVVSGTLLHHWHGSKVNRGYISRHDIMLLSQFDPDVDLVMDVHGLPTLCTDNRVLRDGLRRYFFSRNEDSIDP